MELAAAAYRLFILLSWLLVLGWLRIAISALRGVPQLHDLTKLSRQPAPVA